jgi:probable addiction module antidote protein
MAAKLKLKKWEGLYKALSPGGNPEFGTVMKVIRALGLELRGAAAKR